MSLDVLSNIESLPYDVQCIIYRFHVNSMRLSFDLKHEIHTFKLVHAFRNLIAIIGFRNATWGVLYHFLTCRYYDPVRYKYVHYEQMIFDLWNSMTHEERDAFYVPRLKHAFYLDDGTFVVEWDLNES